jgi:hypothetical protein
MHELNRPVWVVDLSTDGGSAPPTPEDALAPGEMIELVAVLHDELDAPLLLPIAPTLDLRLLDAIARLLRFAVEHGERIPAVAVRYGSEYERALAFEKRLPRWAYEGTDRRDLPSALARVLGPR